jgi:hypothetical protein
MKWIKLAATEKVKQEADPGSQKVALESLTVGQIFSINPQARKFELRSIELKASSQFPEGRILTRQINDDGSFGSHLDLDYGLHKGMKVCVWGHSGEDVVGRAYELFEKIRLKGADLSGVIIDVDRSQFPDCGMVAIWETPLRGQMITEVHAHEIESMNEICNGQRKWGCGDKSLAEIRQIVMDLRGEHDKKLEDRTRTLIRQQIQNALKEHAEEVKTIEDKEKQAVSEVCDKAIQQFAAEFKRISDACVLFVSAGEHNYEADKIGEVLSNYADSVYYRVSTMAKDPKIVGQASLEVLDVISASALKSYYMTRHGVIRKEGDHWAIFSENGKKLGHFASKKKAVQRLRQIEYFKRHGESTEIFEEE